MIMNTLMLNKIAVWMAALECFNNVREDRQLFQKKIYLCQCFGISIPFIFEWSRHGVFSPELNFAANTVIKYAPKFCNAYELTSKEQKIIDYINDLELQIEKKSLMIDEPFFYQLLADMTYAETEVCLYGKSEIAQFLRNTYPIYKEDFNGTYAVFSFIKQKSFA